MVIGEDLAQRPDVRYITDFKELEEDVKRSSERCPENGPVLADHVKRAQSDEEEKQRSVNMPSDTASLVFWSAIRGREVTPGRCSSGQELMRLFLKDLMAGHESSRF